MQTASAIAGSPQERVENLRNASLVILPIRGLPLISKGDDLAALIGDAIAAMGEELQPGDILAVAQKVVSKQEGRTVRLADVVPSAKAIELAERTGKNPRLIECVLSESREVLRAASGVLIVQTRLGHIVANAGIDQSNVAGNEDIALLLPEDPDKSAASLRDRLAPQGGIGVIVSDSFGRPWRFGTTGVAIGIAGPPALVDRRGEPDLMGRVLQATEIAFADAVAAAATLVMGEAAEGLPAAIVRGLTWSETDHKGATIVRPASQDLFR
jgi:coenzyme F420-0:L-glutamate ligase / coenzyme F420-1:gamma-L-glutamate ligase